ncbi:cytochrome C assembly family protein [Alicycliphilus denitrificans]|uniref:Cytochrome c assembly protein n=1 Tax=Alicycliphilus denitrificans (strain DSM 14773 / CIP 107495 / K601) TaxID=596154 RepID=F4GFT1_ALIDK|nr:cytochrome c biogenesis protein CcsA [Alicycliphilus denitrificans]AEB86167.1 cytochrome c assembly protein [Alicycliphilus denitrificans K601]
MILPSASPLAWLLALATAVAYALAAAVASRAKAEHGHLAMAPAWTLHAAALAWGLLGSTPHFGFAAALSMTAWLVLTTYAVERQLFPQMRTRWALCALGGVSVLLAALFPGRPLHVSASPWLPLHLTLGIACYGLFAAAVVHAGLMGRAERQIRLAADSNSGIPLLTLERLTFRFVSAGFVLLSATLVAGWLFSEQLYGRAWLWDHKAVFSVLAWITFAVLLLGRSRFGWRGRSAVRVLYAGAALLLLAYVGSRFVLEVVLRRAI